MTFWGKDDGALVMSKQTFKFMSLMKLCVTDPITQRYEDFQDRAKDVHSQDIQHDLQQSMTQIFDCKKRVTF